DRVRAALRVLKATHGRVAVADFGPLALQAIQHRLIGQGKSRRYVNHLTSAICRVFRWGVTQEIVLETVYRALAAVPGLRRGRSKAKETPPVEPVPEATVQATLPHLSPVVADMVRVQRLTGCRPGEVCIIRPTDVDRSGDVWEYRPARHKGEWRGRERVIFIGPQAQAVLSPYLLRSADAYCFSPAESEKKRRAEITSNRRTPATYGNRVGTNRKPKPKRSPGDRYDANSYRQAIHRAVEAANRVRQNEAEDGEDIELLPKWSPNRLRHAAGTDIRKQFGLEAAQVALGHATADVTQVYAERDAELARRVARKIG
ncbi:tyrosine-type recombinase/integrase, partial [Planctomycetota bacterium]